MKVSKIIFGIIEVALLVLVVLMVFNAAKKLTSVSYDFGYRVFTEDSIDNAPGHDVLVKITSDMSSYEIGELLEEKNLIRDSKLFYIQVMLSAYRNKLQPGTYTLNTSMTPKEMIVEMAGVELSTEEEEE